MNVRALLRREGRTVRLGAGGRHHQVLAPDATEAQWAAYDQGYRAGRRARRTLDASGVHA